jgi:hypothetical protein
MQIFSTDKSYCRMLSSNRIIGKYGSYQLSTINKNAPLIFVVGGITMPAKGNVPPNFYAGDKLPTRNGYMWNWKNAGFDRLKQFNVYVCHNEFNSGLGFKEVVAFNKKYGISPNGYYLVTFSAGVKRSLESSGVLKMTNPNDWSMIILAGAYMSGSWSDYVKKDILPMIEKTKPGSVYYFSIGSLQSKTEGASVENKKLLASNLPWNNVITFREKGVKHGDHVKFTSNFIASNIKVNQGDTIKMENISFPELNMQEDQKKKENEKSEKINIIKKRKEWH